MMILALLVAYTFAIPQDVADAFETWYSKYHRHMTMYMVSKEQSRRAYIENKAFVDDFNSKNHTWRMSMSGRWAGFPRAKLPSIFPRRQIPEYSADNNTLKGEINDGCYVYYTDSGVPLYEEPRRALPDSIDWRSSMSPIRDQGSCGGCYTFGSVGALEGRLNIMYNTKLDLSEQQILDCTTDYGNKGCNGGLGKLVYDYLINNNRLAYELDYPYKGVQGKCKVVRTHAILSSYTCGLGKMQDHLINGPIDIAMYVNNGFMYYSSGFYNGVGDGCDNSLAQANHEMVAVGYGHDNGKLYYILRNSWGTSWGMNGYVYVYDNVCSITRDPEVPLGYALI